MSSPSLDGWGRKRFPDVKEKRFFLMEIEGRDPEPQISANAVEAKRNAVILREHARIYESDGCECD